MSDIFQLSKICFLSSCAFCACMCVFMHVYNIETQLVLSPKVYQWWGSWLPRIILEVVSETLCCQFWAFVKDQKYLVFKSLHQTLQTFCKVLENCKVVADLVMYVGNETFYIKSQLIKHMTFSLKPFCQFINVLYNMYSLHCK